MGEFYEFTSDRDKFKAPFVAVTLLVQVAQTKPPLENQLAGLSERLFGEASYYRNVIVAPPHWLSIKQCVFL